MRGKVSLDLDPDKIARITPAYAGKSQADSLCHKHTGDHPRLCGEKPILHTGSSVFKGSPPPMRGKDEDHRTKAVMSGITPAYAGKRNEVVTMGLFD